MEDARHQAALLLSGYWNDWLVAGGLYRNDLVTVRWLEKELYALRRRVALRDAAALDVDQATAALAQAQAQVATSLAARDQARVALAANLPEQPLPAGPLETIQRASWRERALQLGTFPQGPAPINHKQTHILYT